MMGRCMENGPVRNNTDTGQPAFRRKTRIQGASSHGALSGLLSALNVDTLICGGIGAGAQTALAEAGIRLYGGVSGSADEAVDKLLAGNLVFNPDVHCDHHVEGHNHGNGHGCREDKYGCAGNRGGCQ